MQQVSEAYKESMKSSLRNRSYIMISFGLINQEAQTNATASGDSLTYFSSCDSLFSEATDDIVYATLEENFAKVDGSMYFPPRSNSSVPFYDTGVISKNLISNGNFTLTISLNIQATNFRGLTINFGDNYPINFDIVGNNQTLEVRENTSSLFTTEEVFENTTLLTLIFYKMKNAQSRLRIYSIKFGYGLLYYNDSVLSSSLESYVSPICADIPQIDFSVQIKNYDKYFNVDNPKSAINFLETGQEMEFYYGYQLPESGEIEWIKGGKLLCSDWESDDYTATIRCQDVFRNMDTEYYKGTYNAAGKSYFDLATEVLDDAGISDYYIDPLLKKLYTKNPIPRVTHKEALQIISNACRCVLSQSRDGKIQIKASFSPDITLSSNGETTYSKLNSIINSSVKDEYASLSTNYTTVNKKMYFLPRNSGNYLNTGYISLMQSDENGEFDINPEITIALETTYSYYSASFVFGSSIPAKFIIRTYNNNELVSEYEITEGISRNLTVSYDFQDFDTMKIEFVKTVEPFNHIVLNNFSFGDITNFTMTRTDMTSSPKAIKQELIKEVVVPSYSYQNGNEESLLNEEITVTNGDEKTYFFSEPCYNFRPLLNDLSSGISITSWGNYYITLKFNATGTFNLEIFGYKYKIIEQNFINRLNDKGKTIKWENPLVSDNSMANNLAEWLGEYYKSKVEYEYSTRGNPEIDANDLIYQENEFYKNMIVNVCRETLNFNQSLSGQVTTRRIGG